MYKKRRKSSKEKINCKQKKVTRCKTKMRPVLESERCEDFIKKENTESNQICKNCKHSF